MSDDSLFGLKRETIKAIQSVFSKYSQIQSVLVYGSRAKGNFKPGSDIDLTIIGQNIDLSLKLQIENEIDDLMLPYKVDLSILSEIENPDLVDHIQRVGKVFYQR